MSYFRQVKDWKIRKVAFVMLGILMSVLLANFITVRIYNVTIEDVYVTEMAFENVILLDKLKPEEVKLLTKIDTNKVMIKNIFAKFEANLDLLKNGGEQERYGKKIVLKAANGDFMRDIDNLEILWHTYKKALNSIINDAEVNTSYIHQLSIMSTLTPPYNELYISLEKVNQVTQNIIVKKKDKINNSVIIVLILNLLVFVWIYYIMRFLILGQIFEISYTTRELAKGNLSQLIRLESKNEIGYIARNINAQAMVLRDATNFTKEIGNGNFDVEYPNFEEINKDQENIATSLVLMREQMKKSALADKERNWVSGGLARFAEITRHDNDNIQEISFKIISELVKYVKANQGSMFILNDENEKDKCLEITGAYAYDKKKYLEKKIAVDEGLVGQVFMEREKLYFTKIPQDYVFITSGLGFATPDCLLIMPLKVNEHICGVIELVSFNKFTEVEIDFVEKLCETIAATIVNIKVNFKTKKLLKESNELAERLRMQEEEMRQNMEEMHATQEEMIRSKDELERKELHLEALINNTEDSIITIDNNYVITLMNDIMKKRYEGSQYSGTAEGKSALEDLGEVAEEWKGYYDRALSGERLNFVKKSTVDKENSYRQYFINPIISNTGKIEGASIFSRDVTKQKVSELRNLQLLRDLEIRHSIFDEILPSFEISATLRLNSANIPAREKLNYRRDEELSTNAFTLFMDKKQLESGKMVMERDEMWTEEVKLKDKYGKPISAQVRGMALKDQDGTVEKFIISFV